MESNSQIVSYFDQNNIKFNTDYAIIPIPDKCLEKKFLKMIGTAKR